MSEDLPHRIDMVHDLRQALGLPVVAMAAPPAEVWTRALGSVEDLRRESDRLRRLTEGDPTTVYAEAKAQRQCIARLRTGWVPRMAAADPGFEPSWQMGGSRLRTEPMTPEEQAVMAHG